MLKPYVSRSTKTTGPLLVELVMMFMMVPLSGAAILYQQPEPMWDTWVYQEGEDYHLFFMSKGQIGRAISQDLIHWKHLPVIPNMAKPGDWDAKGMKTGCTVKHDDTYYMSYGSGPRSPIGFLVSKDLINWKRYGDNPVLTSQPPYRAGDHWRDLSSYYDAKEQQWHGFLFGIHEKSSRPSIAHLTSEDYLHWQYHEPVFISEPYSRDNNGFVFLEVPDYFQMGEKHYILFSSVRSRKSDTSGRKDASGTWYLISTRREGPYQVPSRPLLLGSGRGRHDHYVGRTLTYKGKRLLYHHTWGDGPVNWGTLKEVHQNQDGSLCLKYWSDLDLLATETLMKTDRFTLEAVRDTRKLRMFNIDASDIMVTCTLDLSKANAAALIWRSRSKTREGKECATGLLVDYYLDASQG